MKRRRDTRPPAERETALIAAAERLFAERGVAATTVADIAAAAGLAKGTFYLHFETKEHLVAVLKSRFVAAMLEGVAAFDLPTQPSDWWDLLDDFVAAMLDVLLANLALIEITATETPTAVAGELYGDAEAQVVEVMAAGVEAGIAAGVFEARNPRMTVLLLLHAAMCTIEHFVITDEAIDREEFVATTQELVRKALTPSHARGG